MSGPFTLRIVRPYASREDFLEGDYWTVERSEMLLLGVEGVSQGASVTFEIVLENKEIVVRGEGRALELMEPHDGRPGGVKVRFKQLDATSKATLRRALEIQRRRAAEARASVAESPVENAALQAQNEAPAPAPAAIEPPATPPTAKTPEQTVPEREEPSGVHHRIAGPVRAPENRDALLERLRERMRLAKASPVAEKSTAAAE